ncbi:hypothetical protein LZ31DRAFT_550188 [Colletotrichum somersetense]|nr:hypothetical protein LZ31DRAFT_550188 [Colletotrichum somersetense]
MQFGSVYVRTSIVLALAHRIHPSSALPRLAAASRPIATILGLLHQQMSTLVFLPYEVGAPHSYYIVSLHRRPDISPMLTLSSYDPSGLLRPANRRPVTVSWDGRGPESAIPPQSPT